LPIDLFGASIKSPQTKAMYVNAIKRFNEWAGYKTLEGVPDKDIQNKLIEYIVKLNTEGNSYSLQNVGRYQIARVLMIRLILNGWQNNERKCKRDNQARITFCDAMRI
jgi:hypothetical protein